MTSPTYRGEVISYNRARGFGWIRPVRDGDDVFVHVRGLRGMSGLQPGQRVKYQTWKRDGRIVAVDVRRADT